MINKKQIKESKFAHWLKRFANHNIVVKSLTLAVIWVIALIPAWIYIGSRCLIGPAGFWQELALFSIAAIVIGWLQFITAFLSILLTFSIIFQD